MKFIRSTKLKGDEQKTGVPWDSNVELTHRESSGIINATVELT
jgi:hypothetical protein